MTVWLGGVRNVRGHRGKRRRQGGKGVWTEEGRERFKECFGKRGDKRSEVIEDWRNLRIKAEEALKGVERELKGTEKGGWDEECRRLKIKVEEELKKWKVQGGEGCAYRDKKRSTGNYVTRKRREKRKDGRGNQRK